MLFNSYGFIFVFLPIVAVAFFCIARASHRLAALWLGSASLVFYGYWNPQYVLLLLASIAFNYGMGYAIGHFRREPRHVNKGALLLAVGVGANLLLLGYFKYADFFVTTTNDLAGTEWGLLHVTLPLGISFFTFTQIAFLVDVQRGLAREYSLIHYLLFVTYFPHLIAGPVLHHKQMMPQFARPETYRLQWDQFGAGLTLFIIGLSKKVLIADSLAD